MEFDVTFDDMEGGNVKVMTGTFTFVYAVENSDE